MSWTRQYHVHWPFTFARPRSVKRSRRVSAFRLPNSGSTVVTRGPYVARQTLVALSPLRGERRLGVGRVVGAVTLEHGRGGGLEPGGLALDVGAYAALLLRRVTRHLHPVDREQLAPDQDLSVANSEYD